MIPKIKTLEAEFIMLRSNEWVLTAHVKVQAESGWDSVYLEDMEGDDEPLSFYTPDEEKDDE